MCINTWRKKQRREGQTLLSGARVWTTGKGHNPKYSKWAPAVALASFQCCSRDCLMIMVLTLQKSAPNSHLHFSPSLFPGVRDRDGKVLVLLVQRSRTRGWINQSFSNSRQRGRTFENASSCWQQSNKGSLERHAEAVTGMQWASLGLRDLSYNSRIEKWS